MELGWEILLHPLYSTNISLFDYHLFYSIQYSYLIQRPVIIEEVIKSKERFLFDDRNDGLTRNWFNLCENLGKKKHL